MAAGKLTKPAWLLILGIGAVASLRSRRRRSGSSRSWPPSRRSSTCSTCAPRWRRSRVGAEAPLAPPRGGMPAWPGCATWGRVRLGSGKSPRVTTPEEHPIKAVTWHGKRDVRVETVPDPVHPGAHGRDHPRHLQRSLRLRPAPLRDPRPVHGPGRHPRPRAHGHRRGGRLRRRRPARRRPGRDPVPDQLRPLLDVRPGPAHAVRDHPGARAGHGRRAVRLQQALRRGARRRRPSYLRVPQAQYTHIKVPNGPADDRFLFLSDVLPTAWQAVEYADVPEGGTRAGPRRRPDRRDGLRGSPCTRASA